MRENSIKVKDSVQYIADPDCQFHTAAHKLANVTIHNHSQ